MTKTRGERLTGRPETPLQIGPGGSEGFKCRASEMARIERAEAPGGRDYGPDRLRFTSALRGAARMAADGEGQMDPETALPHEVSIFSRGP